MRTEVTRLEDRVRSESAQQAELQVRYGGSWPADSDCNGLRTASKLATTFNQLTVHYTVQKRCCAAAELQVHAHTEAGQPSALFKLLLE